jgi:hypothetical protein
MTYSLEVERRARGQTMVVTVKGRDNSPTGCGEGGQGIKSWCNCKENRNNIHPAGEEGEQEVRP